MGNLKRTRAPQSEMDKLSEDEKKERRAKYKREWNITNKEKVVRMRKDNITKTKEARKVQISDHRKANPLVAFTRNTLTRITAEKAKEAMHKLPYTQDEFISHIESFFVDGMSWDNRDKWHIDHIRPLVSFVKKGIYDLNIINALSNLQPLWACDNLTKSNSHLNLKKESKRV